MFYTHFQFGSINFMDRFDLLQPFDKKLFRVVGRADDESIFDCYLTAIKSCEDEDWRF